MFLHETMKLLIDRPVLHERLDSLRCLFALQIDTTPLIEYDLGRNRFPWRVGSPRQLLGGPNRGWHAVPATILGVTMAEPEKGILII